MAPTKSAAPTKAAPKTKGTTTSSVPAAPVTLDPVAVQPRKSPVQSTPNVVEKNKVADTILQFSEDIGAAEKPPLLPENTYRASIRGTEVRESNKTGNKYVAVTFVIAPENYPVDFDAGAAPEGKTLTYMRLSGEDDQRARWNMRKFCEAIGATMSKEIDTNEWIGLEASILVVHTEFEGEMREEVRKVVSTE